LEQIPEGYREPLILFYREHKSLKQVAQLLDLSEDAARTRVARGRKLLKDRVAAMVETTISRTGPGKAFTTAVVASITGMAIKGSGIATAGLTAAASTAGTTTAIKTVASGLIAKIITAAAVVVVGAGALVVYKQTGTPDQNPPAAEAENTQQQADNGGDAPQVRQAAQANPAIPLIEMARPAQATSAGESVSGTQDTEVREAVIVDSNERDNVTGVSGTIIDKATSKPIWGAEIFCRISGDIQHTVISDAIGRFELLGMAPGEGRGIYVIAKDPYVPASDSEYHGKRSTGRIQISVVDLDTGEGIYDAAFRVKNELEASFFSRKLAPDGTGTRMTTDEKGTAEFANMPVGKYIVSVEAPGYLTSQSEWIEVGDDASAPAIVCLERAGVARFEVSAEVRQLITAESAYICCEVKNCDTAESMPMVTSYGQYDGHMIMLVGENIPDYYQPIINLPEGRYRIDYRLFHDRRGYTSYMTQLPLVEGSATVELIKGRTTTITTSKN